MKRLLFVLLCVLNITGFSQNMNYAHYVLNKLGSEEFKGRGFVDNGDKIAADFIKHQLDSLDIKPFKDGYFQYFNLTVNTFPNKLFCSVNGKELIPGKDFLLDMHSKSCNGSFDIVTVKLSELTKGNKNYGKSFVLLSDDMKTKDSGKLIDVIMYKNTLHAKGYIVIDEKLTCEPSQVALNTMVVHLKSGIISQPLKNIKIKAKNKLLKDYKTQNIFGYIQGEIDSFIVFSAHYDHLGKLGKRATFYGANDNGSGVTMVLNLADYFAHHKPHYTICFMFFSGEEEGLLGSSYAAEHPVLDLAKIKFLFNLDMVGTGQEGIKIVNSTIFKSEMALFQKINKENHFLIKIAKRGAAANSDHYPFYAKGVPSFFIYTLGGSKQYHNIYDKPCQLSLFAFENLEKLLITAEEHYTYPKNNTPKQHQTK